MKKGGVLLVLCMLCLFTYAQKPTDIQQGNLWLSNVKIDGKHDEWPQPLKAFNKATVCWYSIANDDKNLYVAISSERWGKIQNGGITFISDENEITFPYNKRRDRRLAENREPRNRPTLLTDFKEIHIKGIKSINDTLISVYNTYGIKVLIGESYDKKGKKIYNYELAIPVKFIKIKENQNTINYKIRLNGIITFGPSGGITRPIPGKTAKEMMELEEGINDGSRVSQLGGQYTLATKP